MRVARRPCYCDAVLHAYLDTNVFLNFKDIRNRPWSDVLGTAEFVLVVPLVVLDELQGKKDNTTHSKRMRERAARALKFIEDSAGLGSPSTIVPGVSLLFDASAAPRELFDTHHLDDRLGDGRLLAAVLNARARGEHVCLVTNDAGPRMLARAKGVEAFNLPEEWRHTEEPDERDEEIRRLKLELAAYENRAPRLRVAFFGGETRLEHKVPRLRGDVAATAREEMLKLETKHREHVGLTVEQLNRRMSASTWLRDAANDVHEFLKEAERILPRIVEFQNELDLLIPLKLQIENVGTAPAEDVHVDVLAPDGYSLRTRGPENRPFLPPSPSAPMRNPLTARDMGLLARVAPPDFAPDWEALGPNGKRLFVGLVRHQMCDVIERKLFVRVPSDEASSFHLSVELRANHLPTPQQEKLHIILSRTGAHSKLRLHRKGEE